MATNKLYVGDLLAAESYAVYDDMDARPVVNEILITGDLTNDDINIYDNDTIDEMVERSREILVYPDEESFTPQPNIQYYIGPDINGKYSIVIYKEDGTKIVLGTTTDKIEGAQLQKPITNGKFDIGHNNGTTDGRTLQSHTVSEAINELDVVAQDKCEPVYDEFITTNKSTVGAINEVKTLADALEKPFDVHEYQSSKNGNGDYVWTSILTITKKGGGNLTNGNISCSFWVLPNYSGSKIGPSGTEGGVDITGSAPCWFCYHYETSFNSNGQQVQTSKIVPLVHPRESILSGLGMKFCIVHNANKVELFLGTKRTNGMAFKVSFVNECFLPAYYVVQKCLWTTATGTPANSQIYELKTIGYTNYSTT